MVDGTEQVRRIVAESQAEQRAAKGDHRARRLLHDRIDNNVAAPIKSALVGQSAVIRVSSGEPRHLAECLFVRIGQAISEAIGSCQGLIAGRLRDS